MLIRPDVVRGYIGENAVVKGEAVHPVHLDSLGGHLHNHILAACLRHFRKGLVQFIGFRRGVHGSVAYDDSRGSDHSHLFACRFQYGFDHMGRGGLSLCSRHANGNHFGRRITEPGRREKSQASPGLCCLKYCHPAHLILRKS